VTYTGLNVTIPHKVTVMQYLDSISPEAQAIGAVNTIHIKDGKAAGHNTDYFGFSRLLTHNGLDPAGKTVVVLGTGGASRAVLQCLSDRGAHHIILITRKISTRRRRICGPSLRDRWRLRYMPMRKNAHGGQSQRQAGAAFHVYL
jgi:shikimate dehydrogenase